MANDPVQIETTERLNRNLSLLQAGATVTIDIATPAGKKAKFRTIFVGYVPKNYILIQFPEASKLGSFSQYLKQGLTVTVRGLIESSEGAVVAFISNVRQTIQIPSKLLVLEFPYKVSLQKLRSNIRVDTNLKAKIGVGKDYFNAHINNLSISGGQIIVHNAQALMMANDKPIEVIIENFDGGDNLKLQGLIRNVKKQGNDVSLGIHFGEEIKESVLKLIEHTIAADS
ncbi:MAG: flagellar brake domain-containing protein [Thalassotalea sp.]